MPGKGGGKADGKGGGGTRGDGAFTGMGETRSAKAKWGVNVTEQFRIDTDKMLKALREDDVEEIAFPPDLSNDQRRFMHRHCEKLGLFSKSRGKGDKRYLTVTKEKKRGAPQPNQYVEPEPVPEFQLSPGGAAEAAIKKHLAAWPVTEDDLLYDATAQPAPKHSGRGKGGGGKGGGKGGNGATKLAARLAKATAAAAAAERHKAAPQSPFRQRQRERERLPAWEFGERIQALVRDHQVSIVSGETGCGKSTQVPQFILDDATPGMAPPTIVVTQPRRLAAQALAGRIAHERGQEAGAQVGYNIRLDSKSSAATMLTFMTTGVLLRRLASDPLLTDFTHIVMDEVHERDKYADFLMVLLKDVLPRRPDLRLVLMSATIQLTTFSRYFGGAPNITIGASVFPVGEYFLEDVLALTNFVQIGQSRGDSLLGGNKSMGMGGGGGGGSRGPGGGRGVDTTVDDAAYDYTCHMCGKRDFEDAGDFGLHVATCFGVEGGLAEGELVDASTFSLDSLGAGLAGGLDAGLGMQLGEADASKAGGDAGKVTKDAGGGEMSSTADRVGIGIAGVKMESTEADLAEAVARYGAGFDDDAAVDLDLVHALLEHIEQANYGDGAVLVFLPGWDDISRLKDALLFSHRFGNADKYTILPLHSGVAPKEQNLVFKRPKPGQRKIILSTNIAETSVTIDDVVYVIDSGKAKEKSFDPHLNLATLMTGWISAASARQRKGRAGRVQAGVCFHMYSSTRVKSLLPYQQPELLRTPLEELALQVKLLSSVPHQPKGYVAGFLARAPEPPHPKAVENGLALLMDIGALTRDEQMTELGNYLGQLPVDPRVGKMCLLAHLFGVTRLATTIAAGMGYRDPFVLPMNEQAKAKAKASKARFASGYPSDQLALLTAAHEAGAVRAQQGSSAERRFCTNNFLSGSTMMMITSMGHQVSGERASERASAPPP
jgi:ATP-dependent RNA helicase DHX36